MHYGDSSVKIFNDSIEFFNPGALPDSISIEQLIKGNYSSQIRNKKIAAIFKEAGVIEKYGSGIKRIREGFVSYGLKAPVFENFQHGFRVVVFVDKNNVPENVPENVPKNVPENVPENNRIELILIAIKKDRSVNMNKLAIICKVNVKTIKRDLSLLKGKGIIKRIGPDKGGYWKVIENK